jgi:hypothetical protein
MNCTRCDEALPTDGEFITCKGCTSYLHFDCSGVKETTYRGMSTQKKNDWRCNVCRVKTRSVSTSSGVTENAEFRTMFAHINEKLEILTEVNDKMENLQASFYEMKKELKQYKEKVIHLEDVMREKDKKIESMEQRILDLEQYSRMKNVEIVGIEKKQNENLDKLFENLCSKLEINNITPDEVESIHRLPNKRRTSENIIVSFKSRKIRDNFLLKRKTVVRNSDIMNTENRDRIYLIENQSKDFKRIFWDIKQCALERGYKYIWSKNGKIYIKHQDNDKAIRVISKEEIPNH